MKIRSIEDNSLLAMDLIRGVRRSPDGTASKSADLRDWLADLIGGDIVPNEPQFIQGNYDYVYCKIHFSSSFIIMRQQFARRPYKREN